MRRIQYFIYPENVDRESVQEKLNNSVRNGLLYETDAHIFWNENIVFPNEEYAKEYLSKERNHSQAAVRFFAFDEKGRSSKRWLVKQTTFQ